MLKRIYDEVHGFIEAEDVFLDVINSSVFQRLRRIKQTSLANIVYPGANHTRFSHSLGSFFIAKKLIDSCGIDKEQEFRFAALLHDVGYYPFTHAIEGVYIERFKENGSNKNVTLEIILRHPEIREISSDYGIDLGYVRDLLIGDDSSSRLIDGEIDVDRLDYLLRDSKHSGVSLGNIDLERLISNINFNGNYYVIPEKGLISLENFYMSRFHMYQAVYYHKTILGYELMLRKIFVRVLSVCCPYMLTMRGVLDVIMNEPYLWDDEWVMGTLYTALKDSSVPTTLKEDITDFLNRRGPKPLYLSNLFEYDREVLNTMLDLRDALERAGIPKDSIYVFSDKIRIINKEEVLIRTPRGDFTLKEYPGSILSSIPEYLYLSRLYVDRKYSDIAKDIVNRKVRY